MTFLSLSLVNKTKSSIAYFALYSGISFLLYLASFESAKVFYKVNI